MKCMFCNVPVIAYEAGACTSLWEQNHDFSKWKTIIILQLCVIDDYLKVSLFFLLMQCKIPGSLNSVTPFPTEMYFFYCKNL